MNYLLGLIGIGLIFSGIYLAHEIFILFWELKTPRTEILRKSVKISVGVLLIFIGTLLLLATKKSIIITDFGLASFLHSFFNILGILFLCILPVGVILTLMIYQRIEGTQEFNNFFDKAINRKNKKD